MISSGFPERVAILSEGVASGILLGRWDAIWLSIDNGEAGSGGLFDELPDAWCSVVHSWCLGSLPVARGITGVGAETVEEIGSFFLKNVIISAACAANAAFFLFPSWASQHCAFPMWLTKFDFPPPQAYERERPYDELESEVDALCAVCPNHAPTS